MTAHSLPLRIIEAGDGYDVRLEETARLVAAAAGVRRWRVCWQSAGRTPEPWIGPDVLEVLRRLQAEGITGAVVCPAGFVSDHLEVNYDLDIEATALAGQLSLRFARTRLAQCRRAPVRSTRRSRPRGCAARRRHRRRDPSRPMSGRLPGRSGNVRRFVVVGGGISGLAAARVLAGESPLGDGAGMGDGSAAVSGSAGTGRPAPAAHLSARDGEVIVLERSPRLGGKILTGTIAGVPVELGPDQFLRRDPSAERLARLVGLGDELVAPAARAAAVYSRGSLHRLPAGLMLGVPTDAAALEASGILSADGLDAFRKLSGLTGPSGSPGTPAEAGPGAGGGSAELSAGAILRALVGDEVVERLVDPLLGGINAGSVDELSLAGVAPQVARLLAGPPGGLAALSAAVAASSPTSSGDRSQVAFPRARRRARPARRKRQGAGSPTSSASLSSPAAVSQASSRARGATATSSTSGTVAPSSPTASCSPCQARWPVICWRTFRRRLPRASAASRMHRWRSRHLPSNRAPSGPPASGRGGAVSSCHGWRGPS